MRFILYDTPGGAFMEIKEVENLLSVSRSNIRYYEKEGLIEPERGENNYRRYSESDVAMLKKIIILRKLGFSVEEISAMQKGVLLFSDAISEDITRLETEIEKLRGALETAKMLSSEHTTFESMDTDRYWDMVRQTEDSGKGFVDICKDYLSFELYLFDSMWKIVFFHNFRSSRKKYGVAIACGILLLICIIRGVSKVVLWHESFWSGFLYPAIIFLVSSVLVLPIYILSKRSPKAASIISTILLILGIGFITFCVLVILYGIIVGFS